MEIKKTTEYAQFRTITGNRLLSRAHLSNLKRSIETKNLLEFHPIVVNGNMEVIDGQHRLAIAKELNLPIYYIIGKDLGFLDIEILNINVRTWHLLDYLGAYVKKRVRFYSQFEEFNDKYQLGIGIEIALILGKVNRVSKDIDTFKKGSLEFSQEQLELAIQKADMIYDFKNYFDLFKKREFTLALMKIFKNENYDHEHMKKKLEQVGVTYITNKADTNDFLRTLEEIYNFRDKYPTRLF